MKTYDYIVVGSGCSGAISAQTLVEAGAEVAMLDVGFQRQEKNILPSGDFISLRKNDPDQYRYFIGEHGEGINFGDVAKGAQVTPTRQYMTTRVNKYIPLNSQTFSPIESLGYGGNGIGWGLQCWEYSPKDLLRTGLNVARMPSAYEQVAKWIGISATYDYAGPYTLGKLQSYQKSANADLNHQHIYEKYNKHAVSFEKSGFYVGRTPLALITEDFNGRKAYNYHDMDFYTDQGRSAWRPWIAIDALRERSNFTYIGGHLVLRYYEKGDVVIVAALNVMTDQEITFKCHKLILASGALGTARIVLRSLGARNARVPILSNPHTYLSCIQPSMLGKGAESEKLGFGQLSYFLNPTKEDSGLSVATSYSYQSLMLFRVITQAPIDMADARTLLRYIISGLIIIIVQHPDTSSETKYLQLETDKTSPTGDHLVANYEPTEDEIKLWARRELDYMHALRRLGLYTFKRLHTSHGSAVHYAGTIPFSNQGKKLSLDPNGKLSGTKHVYVSDSSSFKYLPAKGLTFTLMANAHIIATNALS